MPHASSTPLPRIDERRKRVAFALGSPIRIVDKPISKSTPSAIPTSDSAGQGINPRYITPTRRNLALAFGRDDGTDVTIGEIDPATPAKLNVTPMRNNADTPSLPEIGETSGLVDPMVSDTPNVDVEKSYETGTESTIDDSESSFGSPSHSITGLAPASRPSDTIPEAPFTPSSSYLLSGIIPASAPARLPTRSTRTQAPVPTASAGGSSGLDGALGRASTLISEIDADNSFYTANDYSA